MMYYGNIIFTLSNKNMGRLLLSHVYIVRFVLSLAADNLILEMRTYNMYNDM